MTDAVAIESRDFWVKVVEMLQQNWALVDVTADGAAQVHFIDDAGTVFDTMRFPTEAAAHAALTRNGFQRFATSQRLQSFLMPPSPPFERGAHPNGPIYSSGRFWR